MNENTIYRDLPVPLTAEEFDQRAADLAAVNQEIQTLTLEKKSVASDYKGRIESAQGRQNDLTGVVAKRAEVRQVECEERLNHVQRLVEIIRLDTGEIVGTRGITSKDIQDALAFTQVEAEQEDGEEKE